MTLSLDDVRSKRFRMARKSGYEVLEVDEFVDEVEVAFEQLTEENQNLQKQIEALRAAPAVQASAPTSESGPREPETIVVTTAAEASSAVVRLVAMATEQAERLVAEATAEAATIREDAATSAQHITGDAQTQAEQVQTDAQQTADRVRADAQSRADALDAEIAARRAELLDGLNAERDALQIAVGRLRAFETEFRTTLTNELREHITTVESRTAQPSDVPDLANPAAVTAAQQRATNLSATSTATGDDASADTATPTSGDSDDLADAAPGSDAAPARDAAPGSDAAPAPDGAPGSEAAPGSGAAPAPGDVAAHRTEDSGSVFPTEDPTDDTQGQRTSQTPRLDALLGDQR